jgi:hypothetical protein
VRIAAGADDARNSWFTALGFGDRALTPVFRYRNAWVRPTATLG